MKQMMILSISMAALILGFAAYAQEELPYIQHKDIIYADEHGVGLLMDIFTPSGKPVPDHYKPSESGKGLGIIDIASGAWHSDRGKIEDHETAKMYHIFCARQYTVFAIRPGSVTRFTGDDMLRHIRMGVRWVKAHAAEYGIDPERLGLTGASAGGHLSCMNTVFPDEARPGSEGVGMQFDTRVKAVGVFFPPTDFLSWGAPDKMADFKLAPSLFFLGGLAGHSDEEKKMHAEAMSPARYVKPGLPPFLIFHGDADPLVPLQQSELMVQKLKEAGVQAELIVKPGGGHPWLTIPVEIMKMADWFDKELAQK
jgi:acetyl esterase/lipase